VAPIIRRNLTFLIVFKLRNAAELEANIEEISNISSKKHYNKSMKQQQKTNIIFYT